MESQSERASWTVDLLVHLFQAFPPRTTIFKESGPRPVLEYNQEKSAPFSRHFARGPELFSGKDVLDLGSGFGGRTVRYAEYDARSVAGLEINSELVTHAEQFARSRGADTVRFVEGFGESLPFDDGEFDLVTMYDVMEHVIDPRAVLHECYRVLRPGGWVATVFPPYYAIFSGPHLQGYATSLPGMNLLFSTRSLRAAARITMEQRGIDYGRRLREVPTDKLWNMNGLTVRGFHRLLRETEFRPIQLTYMSEFFDHRLGQPSGRLRRAILRPVSCLTEVPAQIPILQEAFCSRICAILERP
jgi:SAM-dependent methyltransferase